MASALNSGSIIGIWNPEFGIQNPESRIWNLEYGIQNPQFKEDKCCKYVEITSLACKN